MRRAVNSDTVGIRRFDDWPVWRVGPCCWHGWRRLRWWWWWWWMLRRSLRLDLASGVCVVVAPPLNPQYRHCPVLRERVLSEACSRQSTRPSRPGCDSAVQNVVQDVSMSFVCCICPTNGPICGAGGRGASTVIGRTGLLPWSCRLRVGHPSRQSDTPNRSRGSGPAFTSVEADSAIIRIRSTRC